MFYEKSFKLRHKFGTIPKHKKKKKKIETLISINLCFFHLLILLFYLRE